MVRTFVTGKQRLKIYSYFVLYMAAKQKEELISVPIELSCDQLPWLNFISQKYGILSIRCEQGLCASSSVLSVLNLRGVIF
jgi:hypothetical protein